jgi:hypothetical protein
VENEIRVKTGIVEIDTTKTGAWLTQMLQGHLNYYAVSGNGPSLWWCDGAGSSRSNDEASVLS